MRKWLHLTLVIALTLLTQLGGLAYLASLAVYRRIGWRSPAMGVAVFIVLYSAGTLSAHLTAPVFGRVPLPCFTAEETNFNVQSPLFCALNRNYVTQPTLDAIEALAGHMAKSFPGTKTLVLDANFPFLDGFPLLPHLSHTDGRKVDIAFYYENDAEYLAGSTRSPIGYFAFEQPNIGAVEPCSGRTGWLTLRWNFDWLQSWFPEYRLEGARTREALRWLANEGEGRGIEKVFVEPHIASRLGLSHKRIRFQGCRAARHDDHIHFQLN